MDKEEAKDKCEGRRKWKFNTSAYVYRKKHDNIYEMKIFFSTKNFRDNLSKVMNLPPLPKQILVAVQLDEVTRKTPQKPVSQKKLKKRNKYKVISKTYKKKLQFVIAINRYMNTPS